MIVIGLTGGIGSGKSTVSSYLQSLGIPVFDADESSRAAVRKGSACLRKIVDFFGTECLLATGELNRPWVADRVFHDRVLLKQYEKIVQDQVREDEQRFLAEQRAKGAQAVVLDVPLLIECGWYKEVDRVWLVSVPREVQVRRAMQRDHSPEETVTARIDAQMSLADKKRYADVVIDNSGTLEHTRAQVAGQLREIGIVTDGKTDQCRQGPDFVGKEE